MIPVGTIASIAITYVFLLCWISGANDAKYPGVIGRNRGALLIQATPIYKFAFWLYSAP